MSAQLKQRGCHGAERTLDGDASNNNKQKRQNEKCVARYWSVTNFSRISKRLPAARLAVACHCSPVNQARLAASLVPSSPAQIIDAHRQTSNSAWISLCVRSRAFDSSDMRCPVPCNPDARLHRRPCGQAVLSCCSRFAAAAAAGAVALVVVRGNNKSQVNKMSSLMT